MFKRKLTKKYKIEQKKKEKVKSQIEKVENKKDTIIINYRLILAVDLEGELGLTLRILYPMYPFLFL